MGSPTISCQLKRVDTGLGLGLVGLVRHSLGETFDFLKRLAT